jgi:hypothetical protein
MSRWDHRPDGQAAGQSGSQSQPGKAASRRDAADTGRSRALFAQVSGDVSGAFADLGTFLPLVLGVLAVNKFDPVSVLTGFGFFALATAAIYRRPVPVQPMKAVAAIIIATGLSAGAVAATGILLGVILIALALTGAIERLNRAIPQSVLTGVSLGIGIHLAIAGLRLVSQDWAVGIGIFALVMVLLQTRLSALACLAGLIAAAAWGLAAGTAPLPGLDLGLHLPAFALPSLAAFREAAETAVLPQFMLTIANAVLATAAIAAGFFPQDAKQNITPRRLALSTGGLDLLLAPLGALPMCHGAGGLVAQHKFGARTGLAPALFGATCLGLGVFLGNGAQAILGVLPLASVGALLTVAGGELALSKRLFDGRLSCLAVMLLTAAVCVLVNVAVGVIAGLAAEFIRSIILRRLNGAGEAKI